MMAHGVGAGYWGEGKNQRVSWKSLERILGYARPYRFDIVLTSVLVVVTDALGLVRPSAPAPPAVATITAGR